MTARSAQQIWETALGELEIEVNRANYNTWLSGTVGLRYTKPVVDGDTLTIKGRVTETKAEESGTRVSLEMRIENQNGDMTAVGTGGALIPIQPAQRLDKACVEV